MTRRRWKLVALWVAAVVLCIVAAAAIVYQTARAAVEESVQGLPNGAASDVPAPVVSFSGVRLSRESWIVLEFAVDFAPESSNRPPVWVFVYGWELRQCRVHNPFNDLHL